MIQSPVTRSRIETPERWAKALERAIANALDVLVSTDGSAFVESASKPGLLYSVSRESCTCPAGLQGMICQHRAVYLAQIGELSLEPAAPAVEFICDNSDRYQVLVDGAVYGDAVAAEYGAWRLFAGRFPAARSIGYFSGMAEIERYLAATLPAAAPVAQVIALPELPAPASAPVMRAA